MTFHESLEGTIGWGAWFVEGLFNEGELGESCECGLNDAGVFFGFEAAGAVEESAAGAKGVGGGEEELGLEGGEFAEFCGIESPAGFRASVEDAGI